MKKIFSLLFIFSALFIFAVQAQARVYWIGRNIDMTPADKSKDNHNMIKVLGHSYIIILPEDRELLKSKYPHYAELEVDLGCGNHGVVIGAYPGHGTEALSDLDGNLEAMINAEREFIPTRHFFCGTKEERSKWNFVGGLVKTKLPEEDFVKNLITKTYNYIHNTKIYPVNYHAVRSTIDGFFSDSNKHAQNCNAFAFSLLAYSGATSAPDIGAGRIMPGNRNLLDESLFLSGPQIRQWGDDYTPELIKNDTVYKARVNKIKQVKMKMMEINSSINRF